MESRNQWMPDVLAVVAADPPEVIQTTQGWRWMILGAVLSLVYFCLTETDNRVLSGLGVRYSRLNTMYVEGSMFSEQTDA